MRVSQFGSFQSINTRVLQEVRCLACASGLVCKTFAGAFGGVALASAKVAANVSRFYRCESQKVLCRKLCLLKAPIAQCCQHASFQVTMAGREISLRV